MYFITPTMSIETKFHASREQITAEEAEIDAARGNPAKFAPLYNRYYARILGFVYQRVETKDDAYDITAQTFIAALENIGKYKSLGVPFSAWLFRIALNELSSYYRKAKVRQSINIDDTQVVDVLTELGEENSAITDARLMKAMQQLEPSEIQLLEMRFFDKRPFKEVCEVLNISETAAKARVYRLLERLKTIYTELQ
ncbi:MAG: sigma-70 family RNA polymerase sigma factor [Bacteroidetes bacterium]|nr:sigma-70 family RNA polymerase sigma factor [Bacteroidota bacterium]PHX82132.1 MAG: RNA polymerase [Flavobacteriales bacterium]